MVATPVSGNLVFTGTGGQPHAESITTTDVVDGFVTFNSTGLKYMRAPYNGYLSDLIMAGDGTDTKQWILYVNGKDTGYYLRIAQFLTTVDVRIKTPIPIAANALVQLKEKA